MSKSKLPIEHYLQLSKREIIKAFGFDPYLLNDLAEISTYEDERPGKEAVVLIDFSKYSTVEIPIGWLENKRHKKTKGAIKDNYLVNIDGIILQAQAQVKKEQKFKKALKKW